jgi:hypothetical protein
MLGRAADDIADAVPALIELAGAPDAPATGPEPAAAWPEARDVRHIRLIGRTRYGIVRSSRNNHHKGAVDAGQ